MLDCQNRTSYTITQDCMLLTLREYMWMNE